MNQLTVRGIPKELDAELRSLSRQNRTSLNKTVVSVLEKAVGKGKVRPVKKRDLSSIAGKWTVREASDFDGRIGPFESLDKEVWQ